MECPNCGTENVFSFFKEEIDCPHCEGVVDINYYMCPECGSTFKIAGDEVYSCVQFTPDEFKNIFGETKEGLIEKLNTDMMSDSIHSCIKCGGLSFEIDEGVYKCNRCGFEVEVQ